MKTQTILLLIFILLSFKLFAQDTIRIIDAKNYVGRNVTFRSQVSDFDSRKDYTYLHFGGHYPNQDFSIIINRENAGKPVKLKRNIMLGREMVYFTGTVTIYNGPPDTTSNYKTEAIRKDAERDRALTIGGTPYTTHFGYNPRTIPIDLKGKLVMVISEQKQIGKRRYPVMFSLY